VLQLKKDKVELENQLEQEQEALVNRLWKRMDKLEAEKRFDLVAVGLWLTHRLLDPVSIRGVYMFCASTQCSLAPGVMVLSCSSVLFVRPCMRPETLLTQYLAEYSTHFHQPYINDALWDRDECVTV